MLIFSIIMSIILIYLIFAKSKLFKFKTKVSDKVIINLGIPSAIAYGFATIIFIKINITRLHLNHIILVMLVNIISIGLILLLSFLVDTKYETVMEV